MDSPVNKVVSINSNKEVVAAFLIKSDDEDIPKEKSS